MEAREIIEIFDSCWFEMEIFKKHPVFTQSSSSNQNPGDQFRDKAPIPDFVRVPSIITRSMSEQLSFKLSPNSLSPNSFQSSPKLQPILSGKETNEENEETSAIYSYFTEPGKRKSRSRGNKKSHRSKSLSELEYEELKGFMDLGFVFSEEDKDTSLVSIIPGLQRLGKNKDGEDYNENSNSIPGNNEVIVSRPYLSEAWEEMDWEKKENPLENWRIPALNNEINMKDNLRWWAHAVASTVR